MKRVWLCGLLYIIVLVCLALFVVTMCSRLHQPFLANEAKATDKAVTTYLRSGNLEHLQAFTSAEQSHLQDVRRLLIIALSIIIIGSMLLLLFWFKMSYGQQQGVLLSPLLFLFYFSPLFLINNFSKSFAVFHQLLFPQGNYIFPFDSLLITTYPEIFFAKMLGLLLLIILLFSCLKLVAWKYIGRKLSCNN